MLKKYLVPCVTENVNIVTDFRSTLPTTCPNNNTHVINENGIYAITSISENKVVIDEGIDVPSGGYFRVDNHEMDIVGGTGTVTNKIISYPYNVGCYSLTITPRNENINDVINMNFIPGMIGGFLSVNSGIGNKTFAIINRTIPLNPGFKISMTDDMITNDLGEIIIVDAMNITTSKETTNDFGIGSKILITIPRVQNMRIVNDQNINIGMSKIGCSGLPANTPAQILYTNMSGENKKFNFFVEMQF